MTYSPMVQREELTPKFINSVIEHCDGQFLFRHRSDDYFASVSKRDQWNRSFAGKPVSVKRVNGYLAIRVCSHPILLHRLIWMFHYGAWPDCDLDHINGNKSDNRIENLRLADKSLNMRNQHLRSDSTSGCPGVHFCQDKVRKPWVARIGVNGKWKNIGYFATREEAIAVRKARQIEYGFTARHGVAPTPAQDAAA